MEKKAIEKKIQKDSGGSCVSIQERPQTSKSIVTHVSVKKIANSSSSTDKKEKEASSARTTHVEYAEKPSVACTSTLRDKPKSNSDKVKDVETSIPKNKREVQQHASAAHDAVSTKHPSILGDPPINSNSSSGSNATGTTSKLVIERPPPPPNVDSNRTMQIIERYMKKNAPFQDFACFVTITAAEFTSAVVCPTAIAMCIFDVREKCEVVSHPWKLQQFISPKSIAYRSGLSMFDIMSNVVAHETMFGYQFVDRSRCSMSFQRVRHMIMIADSVCGLPLVTDNKFLFGRLFGRMPINVPISNEMSKKFRGANGEYLGMSHPADILGVSLEMSLHMCQIYNSIMIS